MSEVNSFFYWEKIYQNNGAGWDLGRPTPVFERLLDSDQYPPGRMVVLGAGMGHDARLFAAAGFTVTAVDFAASAAAGMRDLAQPQAPVTIIQADSIPKRQGIEELLIFQKAL